MWRTLLVFSLLLRSAAGLAQTDTPKDDKKAGAAFAAPDEDGAKGGTKQGTARALACRQAGVQQGLRGPALSDHVQVCVLEARLACLKQAIAEKAYGPQRKSFIESCLDKPS